MVYNQRLMKWMDSWKTVESFGSFKKNFSFSKRPPGHFQHGGAAEMKEITTLSTIPDGDENLSEEQIELKVVKGKDKGELSAEEAAERVKQLGMEAFLEELRECLSEFERVKQLGLEAP